MSQLQHTVEGMDGEVHLGRPALVHARAQPVADHLLEPGDGRLGSGPLRVSGGLLPGSSSVFGDELKMAVALRWGLSRPSRSARPWSVAAQMIAASG